MGASSVSGAVVDAPSGVNIPINIESVTQPVADTSRRVFQRASDGAHWYVEQWEDLFAEARHAALGANAHLGVADVLAALPSAKIVSDISGRLRVRTKSLKWQDQLAAQCSQVIGALPGIRQVDISALTGSILVHYDPASYPSSAALLEAVAGAQPGTVDSWAV